MKFDKNINYAIIEDISGGICMKKKLQIFDLVQIFGGLFLGLGSKILEGISGGDIIYSIINILSLLAFIHGIINFLEDRYNIRVINLKTNVDYSK